MGISLRAKLILVVLVIAFSGLAAVVYSSLTIVRDSQRETIEISNRQVSDLVSRSILNQVLDYKKKFDVVFSSWTANPDLKLEKNLFADFLTMEFIDSNQQVKFSWIREDELREEGLHSEQLLGIKKREDLFSEIRHQLLGRTGWMIFNSTVKPLLPTILLATLYTRKGASVDQEEAFVALAEIRAEKLLSSVQGRPGQELTLVDSHQNILISTQEKWDPSDLAFQDEESLKILSDLKDGEKRFITLMGKKGEEPKISSFYRFREGGGLTLLLQEPQSNLRQGEQRIQMRSMAIAAIVLILTINLILLFASSITSPLTQLMKLMEKVGKGEFTGKIKVKSSDEIGRVANMFNKMMGELKKRDDEIESAKSRLIQSEKMSAFGQMSAGIAHEVKNPLAGILGYAQMSKKKLPQGHEVLPYIEIIEKETVRCKEIVENLMKFARQEKAIMSRIDINKTVKDSIRLVEHQLSISGIKVVQAFALDGAPIWIRGNSNQIQQVMMNLMLNAQQAMENKGTLTISTHFDPEGQKVLLMVSDTGSGMSAEVKARIFEPFFTTKGAGKGTGLGLAVSIGIVKDHGGLIDVESAQGKGTTFTLTLPCDRAEGAEPATESKPQAATS